MSFSSEISTIRPENPLDEPNNDLRFSYSTETYDSWKKEGFTPPLPDYRNDKHEIRFMSRVDLKHGKVRVEITKLVRIRARDYSEENKDKVAYRDFLTWESNWHAKNWLGVDIMLDSHIEGKYVQQTKKLVMDNPDPTTGRVNTKYVRSNPRDVYTIPFSKEKVEEILKAENPFGPDSINITDFTNVNYVVKIQNELGVQNFRCGSFTYEQFCEPWKTVVALATKPGGPAGLIPWHLAELEHFDPVQAQRYNNFSLQPPNTNTTARTNEATEPPTVSTIEPTQIADIGQSNQPLKTTKRNSRKVSPNIELDQQKTISDNGPNPTK
jgi:hypothetical protein